MTSTFEDRIDGITTSAAVKVPCRVATTANVTLSGLQDIDGVTLVADDRVLVKDQDDATENGIWVASSTSWSRAEDFDGNRDVVTGTLVRVNAGTVSGDTIWRCTAADPIVIGTSSITFALSNNELNGVSSFMETVLDDTTAAAARTTLGLGTAAVADTGVSNGNVPAMDATGYPAANGSQITALNATQLTSGTVPAARLPAATDSAVGALETATQAEMETATATDKIVTPGRVKYDPGVSKAGAAVSFSSGTPSLDGDHNIASLTDNGVGDITVTFDTAFSNTNYRVAGAAESPAASNSARAVWIRDGGRAVGSCRVEVGASGGREDIPFTVDFLGDL